MSNIVAIDNTLGVNLLVDGNDLPKGLTALIDSDIYGEAGGEDCPFKHNCYCPFMKMGIMNFGGNMGTKDIHIENSSPWPMHHIHSYGTWNAATDLFKVRFHNFNGTYTRCNEWQKGDTVWW